MEIDFLRSVGGDQEITITSFVQDFSGSNAHIACEMLNESGKPVSRCIMIVACIDKNTNRAMDWPTDSMALFFENG